MISLVQRSKFGVFKSATLILLVSLAVCMVGSSPGPGQASAQANISITVISSLSIQKKSDMSFGVVEQGAPAASIDPGSSENASNASFEVRGEPNRSFSIELPSDQAVVLQTNSGATSLEQIPITQFRAYPGASDAVLDQAGSQSVFVGATRSSIDKKQAPGSYSGTFTITVVY